MTATTALAPPRRARSVSLARLLVERHIRVNVRRWINLAFELFEPLLYLLAIGYGLGTLVGSVQGDHMSYAAYVAPGLLAGAAMNAAINETTFRVFLRIKHERFYDSLLVTPLGIADMAVGEVSWAIVRAVVAASGFLLASAVLGLIHSAWALLSIPAAALIGFAFGSAGLAATSFLRNWQDFQLIQLVTLPMFMFSTTFYPLTVYPHALRPVVVCLPLYHAIVLTRGLVGGHFSAAMLIAIGYLVAIGGLCLRLAIVRLRHALRT
jgi:lipooligosaccharide transport system permease protein